MEFILVEQPTIDKEFIIKQMKLNGDYYDIRKITVVIERVLKKCRRQLCKYERRTGRAMILDAGYCRELDKYTNQCSLFNEHCMKLDDYVSYKCTLCKIQVGYRFLESHLEEDPYHYNVLKSFIIHILFNILPTDLCNMIVDYVY